MIVRGLFFKVRLLQVASRFGTIVFDWSEDLVNPRSLHATGYEIIFNQGRVTITTCHLYIASSITRVSTR